MKGNDTESVFAVSSGDTKLRLAESLLGGVVRVSQSPMSLTCEPMSGLLTKNPDSVDLAREVRVVSNVSIIVIVVGTCCSLSWLCLSPWRAWRAYAA